MRRLIRRWLGIDQALLPIELERGKIYVIEAMEPMEPEGYRDLSDYLAGVKAKTGCEFVILDYGFKISLHPAADRGPNG
jgi:hypothetical protein